MPWDYIMMYPGDLDILDLSEEDIEILDQIGLSYYIVDEYRKGEARFFKVAISDPDKVIDEFLRKYKYNGK